MSTIVKICGLKTLDTLDTALDAGADMVGFVFFPKSPRNIGLADAARFIAHASGHAETVALVVDADDASIASILDEAKPDWLQLHGSETPERVAEIRKSSGKRVMKALPIATAADLAAIPAFEAVADRLLFDAKPPKDATRPGGLGVPFDWNLLHGVETKVPFMLSGGLDPDNVAEALRITHAPGVDVSSGVERAPGEKDPDRIRAFIRAARGVT
ncbi:N-(5'-phosphoribosyl)anthranilate isomerase [Variibacter gotjawalensis]|uniref:N-(5'-phosphoribosyl)anthranilate isomerase n=1 Tax=Variibacter gotjawalensis TaxID=1333996 RepID=A0A0S3Q0I8_9BRAD|nr:phosphoribosylanthranilate isomerase [Variibacter gotjawalensis]NIK47559.1 phosphoribosylanthranilate isomerase [Variibacter gotjawalensis]RZS49456.1 phosphoribosylanthranilate isomerase [Variibacter gotjawalensis]BAT61719.1 N-(5'-phosphoribosyl)anthranilate isomerase [Variibacter gotjawalensis]